jgi:GTPase SAR1 family protein
LGESKSEVLSRIYQWACHLAAEQGEEEYYWTSSAESLFKRLLMSRGRCIAVVGLQGVGKTALRVALEKRLKENGKKAVAVKFGVPDWAEKLRRPLFEADANLEVLFSRGLDYFLIDLPDYDRSNISKLRKQLDDFQALWERRIVSHEGGYFQNVNIVFFFQKELFYGHFWLGKLDTYEIKPLSHEELISCYKRNFGSTFPFQEEALKTLALLSRGIFRRFKKYVRMCLDNYFEADVDVVKPENIREWITLNQLIEDAELDLMTIFPKEREHRMLSIQTLKLLSEKGPLPQQQIVEEVFDGAKMKASRVLNKLETYQYIKRERRGKEKIVSLTQ